MCYGIRSLNRHDGPCNNQSKPLHYPRSTMQSPAQSNRTSFKYLLHSEPMLSATGASNSCTIVAKVDIVTEIIIAALAMSFVSDSTPVWMVAVVMLSKHRLDLVHSGFLGLAIPGPWRTLVCAIDEALFVPLRTGACLPTSSTYLTKFNSAVTLASPWLVADG